MRILKRPWSSVMIGMAALFVAALATAGSGGVALASGRAPLLASGTTGISDSGAQFNVSGLNIHVKGAINIAVSGANGSLTLNTSTLAGNRKTVINANIPSTLTGYASIEHQQVYLDLTLSATGVPVRIKGTPGKDMTIGLATGHLLPSLLGTSAAPAPHPPQASATRAHTLSAVTLAGSGPTWSGFASALGEFVINWLRRTVAFFLLGLALLLVLPATGRIAELTARTAPWTRFGLGVVVFFTLPMLALALLLVGIFIGLWWLGLLLLFLDAVLVAFSYAMAGLIGAEGVMRLIRGADDVQPVLALLIGVAVLSLIGLLPYVGSIVNVVAIAFGLGSILLSGRSRRLGEPTS